MGFFVAFDYTQTALDDIGRFLKQTGKVIVATWPEAFQETCPP